ncbi:hypothetical protein KDA82_37075, partial [Streptomyces daliensis]|nr:hypothetical protein [Streptomyces daliensis]
MRVSLGVTGTALLAVGVWLLASGTREGTAGWTALWLAGAVGVHDLLLAPLVLLCGLLLRRALPRGGRGVLRGGLITAGCLTLVALPVLLRPGVPRNPTVLPLDYPRGWALTLVATVLITACVLLVRGTVTGRAGGGRPVTVP